MINKKALIFDFDGTIVDSLSLVWQALNNLSPKYRYKIITNEEFEVLRGKEPKEIMNFLGISKLKIPFLAYEIKKTFQDSIKDISLIPGMRDVLIELNQQGYILGIITSNGKKNVEDFFKIHDINFIKFIYGDVNLFGKASSIDKALKENEIDKLDAIYIGDEIRDVKAAKEVGIKNISVCWGFNSEEALIKVSPDYIVKESCEIIRIASQL
ncbi:MAG: HAD-IA family hydrolase [bacterium]|nr:HAD-IA family hydrolase [bacterium]